MAINTHQAAHNKAAPIDAVAAGFLVLRLAAFCVVSFMNNFSLRLLF